MQVLSFVTKYLHFYFLCYTINGMSVHIIIDLPMNLKTEKSLFLTFPYNATLVNIMRSYSQKWWHSHQKMWELPYACIQDLQGKLSNAGFDYAVSDRTTVIDIATPSTQEKCLNCDVVHEFKTQPRNHQKEGFNYGMNSTKWLLADDPGLGKTFQTLNIAIAKRDQKPFKHCLIVVGVNNLKLNWVREIKTHTNEKCHVLGQRVIKAGINKGKFNYGGTKEKLEDLNSDLDSFFIITNIESLRTKEIVYKLEAMCDNGTIGMCIADEIHFVRNPNSQQGKGFQKLLPKERIALSGTPLINRLEDLYMIMKWLDYERHTYSQFKNHYCIMGGFGGHQIVGYKNKEEIIKKLGKFMLRRKKEDVLDLPEINNLPIYLELNKKEQKIYNEVKTALREEIDKIKLSPNPLAMLTRLRQATAYTGLLSSTVKESTKMEMMIQLIEEAISNDEKVVVFSQFSQVIDEAFSRCAKYNPAKITGDVNVAKRDYEVDRFQNDDTCKVMLGTTQAMGTGITLTASNNVIFLDEPWSQAHKRQAMDRCHRIGTKKTVNVYTLICENTVDEVVNEIVIGKGELASYFVDGKTKQDYTNRLLNTILGD